MTFSVLQSVYKKDNPAYLSQSLQSIAENTVQPAQVVLVKDGTLTAELEAVIEEWSSRIPLTVVGYEENHGLAYALNYGMDFCTGNLIARMDADDICYPERFEKQMEHFKNHPDCDVLGTGIEEFYVSQSGVEIRSVRLYPSFTDSTSKSLYKGTPLAHPTVMIRSEILKKFRYNLKNQKYSQDIELWFRLLQNGIKIHTLQEPLLHFRITDKTFARRNITKARTELKIYLSALMRMNGFSFRLVFLFIRFCSRLLPVSIIKKMYFSKSRKALFNFK